MVDLVNVIEKVKVTPHAHTALVTRKSSPGLQERSLKLSSYHCLPGCAFQRDALLCQFLDMLASPVVTNPSVMHTSLHSAHSPSRDMNFPCHLVSWNLLPKVGLVCQSWEYISNREVEGVMYVKLF